MKSMGVSVCLGLALLLSACGKKQGVLDTQMAQETRVVTMRDENFKLDATSTERFSEPVDSPVLATFIPPGWLEQPASTFRLLNYRFGNTGECWVSISSGGVLGNLNRWRGQFDLEPQIEADLEKLERVDLIGSPGYWVEAAGHYKPGMNQPPREGQALAGVIAESKGRIVTVKMVGSQEDVDANKDLLRRFIAGLKDKS
jgi:hypothetical protein